MFHKLRNKFILFNLGITSIVVLIVFSAIYFSTIQSTAHRPPIEHISLSYTNDISRIVVKSIQDERENASKKLLSTLIISGISIEICVTFISYFLAELAIKPVKEAYESQKLFIANASHEIKTPLAAISANLEAANLSDNKWIKNAEYETQKITDLNNNLLNLARIDLTSAPPKTETKNLKSLIDRELKTFSSRIESSNKKICITTNLESCTKDINKSDFCELLDILLDNALKYCDKEIIVSLDQSKITIKNDGKLIPKEKLPHIFDRFYQADKTSDGVGLGLSIAISLADRNKWKLHVETNHKYNIFTLTV